MYERKGLTLIETIIINIYLAYTETFLYFFQCTGEVCVSGPIC